MLPPKHASILFDFECRSQAPQWSPLNDTVMGGCSSSVLRDTRDGTAIFTGTTSLKNRGGFASVRAKLIANQLAGAEGLAIRVRGDGRTYRLLVSEDDRPGRGCYDIEFAAEADTWQTIGLPFVEMRFNLRGRRPPRTRPAAEKLQSIGLLIGDKSAGDFALEVDWIAAYR